jgi:putative ABC transport system permease protein
MIRWFYMVRLRFRSLFRMHRVEQELTEELCFHLEYLIEKKVVQGMAPEDARYAALRELGGVEQIKEGCRDMRRVNHLEGFIQDLRYGLRQLRRSPGFAAVTVLTLALGIGANTAIFSVVEAVLLRPLPYGNASRLALVVDAQDPQDGGFLYKDYEACKSESATFEDLAVYYRDSGYSRVTLTAGGEPESVQGTFVSANFFPLMGVSPLLGRWFTPEEETRRERVVLLSYGLWLRHFGGSPEAIGKTLQIDGKNSQVIGVMPAAFQFPARDQQFWAPLTTNRFWGDPELTTNVDPRHTRLFYERWQVVGRLKPGASIQQAQAETDTIFARIDRTDPETNRGTAIKVVPLRVNISGKTRRAFAVLLGAVFFVLLIACSNVANMILARGTARGLEMAVRAAIGAGRGRLLRQLLTESALLALLGGGLGLLLASYGIHLLVRFGPSDIPRLEESTLDARVLIFTLGISILAAVVCGLAPAWRIAQGNPSASLKREGGGASEPRGVRGTRDLLVIVQYALAVVLLTGAGLLTRSFLAVEAVDLGFQPEQVLTMRINMPAGVDDARRFALHREVLERVQELPGVGAAGAISDLFELGNMSNLGLRAIEGRRPEPRQLWTPLIWKTVSGDFFQAVGARLLRGRYFSEQDGPGSPLVAIIDESMAHRYWPGGDPVGQRIKGQDPRGPSDDWVTVIGVVPDMRRNGLERQSIPHVFEWYKQAGEAPQDLVVRATGDPRALSMALRQSVRGLDATAIISPVETLDDQLSKQLSPRRFQSWLLGLFSFAAFLLAGLGLFGVMHYTVARRTREFGVRVALGATRTEMLKLVVGQGLKLALLGVAAGAAGALALTRFHASMLFGVEPGDPLTFIGVLLILTGVALLASYIPARRATKVDPMIALRYE